MGEIFDLLVHRPFSWLLLQLYAMTNSYALAIILFALVSKIVLLYFTAKGKLGSMRQQRVQLKLKPIQKQYASDKEKLNAETMKMYQAEGVSPMGGCLWMLLPWPVLIALYTVIREPLTRLMNFPRDVNTKELVAQIQEIFGQNRLEHLVEHVSGSGVYPQLELAQIVHENFEMVNASFGGVLRDIDFSLFGTNLANIPKMPWAEPGWIWLIPLVSATTAYGQFLVSTRMSKLPENPQTKYMSLLGPVMSLWFGFIMPAAMSLYWIANNVFGMAQDAYLSVKYNKQLDEEDKRKAELEARRKEAEAKQKEEDRIRRAEAMAKKNKNAKKYKMTKHPKKK